jgi:hypothetical protein
MPVVATQQPRNVLLGPSAGPGGVLPDFGRLVEQVSLRVLEFAQHESTPFRPAAGCWRDSRRRYRHGPTGDTS